IERYNIVEWSDVQEEVANQISDFINSGLPIIAPQSEKKKIPVTVYAESTPNPSVMKFVTNKPLVKNSVEFKNIEEAQASDLATELFKFSFVKERSEEHTSELQSREKLVCRLLLEKKK